MGTFDSLLVVVVVVAIEDLDCEEALSKYSLEVEHCWFEIEPTGHAKELRMPVLFGLGAGHLKQQLGSLKLELVFVLQSGS